MPTRRRPARYGPFHRQCQTNPDEIEKVVASGQLRGRPRGNIYAGLIPAVKAWAGPLPSGVVGYEFYTAIEPDPTSAPHWPEWSEGRPGVQILEVGALVAIDVIVSKRQDPE
jgi:hypothetical protein